MSAGGTELHQLRKSLGRVRCSALRHKLEAGRSPRACPALLQAPGSTLRSQGSVGFSEDRDRRRRDRAARAATPGAWGRSQGDEVGQPGDDCRRGASRLATRPNPGPGPLRHTKTIGMRRGRRLRGRHRRELPLATITVTRRPYQLCRELPEAIVAVLGPAIFDGDVLAVDVARPRSDPAWNAANRTWNRRGRSACRKPITGIACLLRARRERPSRRRAAESRDELAPSHGPLGAVPMLKR